jgi:hypothetical protein
MTLCVLAFPESLDYEKGTVGTVGNGRCSRYQNVYLQWFKWLTGTGERYCAKTGVPSLTKKGNLMNSKVKLIWFA